MPHAELISELRASRRWVTFMAWLAILLIGLWCLFTAYFWLATALMKGTIAGRFDRAWMGWYYKGFFIQLTLLAYAGIVPFIHLLRYAHSLGDLKEDSLVGLEHSLQLHRTFWTQTSYLAWGMVWLLTYLLGVATLGVVLHWQ